MSRQGPGRTNQQTFSLIGDVFLMNVNGTQQVVRLTLESSCNL